MTSSAPVDHFAKLVPWSEFGPPLRPAPADIALVQAQIDLAVPRCAVLLGLTPEIAGCTWPEGVDFIAVDHSQQMIEELWPHPVAPLGARVLLADWSALPVRSGSADLVIGDGCLTVLTFDGWRRLAREMRRVLAPGGRLVLRVFIRPEPQEPVAAIRDDLTAGRIETINALKLRLFAAVHADGARLDDVWQAWSTMRRAAGPGYSVVALAGLERYRGSDARYFLGTPTEVRSALGTELREVGWFTPAGYELAERCPTVVFEGTDSS